MSTAAVQSRLASLSVNKDPLSPLTPPPPSAIVKELLEKNHAENDIYFGSNHFHNHFPHALLSQFTLGAPESRLKKEWEIEEFNPIPKKQSTEITDKNWKDHIGVDKFYPNYLEFFQDRISKNGVPNTILSYALDETALPSFVSGAVHPLIHTGFGVEFGINDVVAEGLAEMCVHPPAFAPVVDAQLYSKPVTGTKSLLTIANEIHNDKVFDKVVTFKDFPKSEPLLKSKPACDAIKEYVMQWKIDETPEGFGRAHSELFALTTHFTFSSAFPPPHIVNDPKFKGKTLRPLLDFFLMHTLTATFALRAILPYVPMEKRTLLLRTDLAAGLTYYVARGRPLIQPEKLPKTAYSWDEMAEKTWSNEDLHVPKVIRALKTIAVECGEMDEELARNSAGLVVREKIENRKRWSMYGHGFDETWDEVLKEN